MNRTECLTDLRNEPRSPITTGNGNWPNAVRLHKSQAAANALGRQFDRVAIGFLLGGAILGTAGGILGALMPYHHPVARVISVLWWGIYWGGFGAGMGALLASWTKGTPAVSSRRADKGITAGAYTGTPAPESPRTWPTVPEVVHIEGTVRRNARDYEMANGCADSDGTRSDLRKGRPVVGKYGKQERIAMNPE